MILKAEEVKIDQQAAVGKRNQPKKIAFATNDFNVHQKTANKVYG